MALEFILNFKADAQGAEVALKTVVDTIKETEAKTAQLNRRQQTLNRLRSELAVLAREERAEAFSRLSAEEQLNRLQERREQIQQRLARTGENEFRRAALMLQLRRTEDQLSEVETARAERREKATGRLRSELAVLARKQRVDAFSRLPVEQQLNRLQERRAQIQERLARAGGNEFRRAALLLQLRRTEGQISALQPGAQGGGGGFFGGVGRRAAGAFGGLFAVNTIRRQVRSIIDDASRIINESVSAGVSTDFLQQSQFAARQSNAGPGDMTNSLRDLKKSMARGLGSGDGREADVATLARFERLGITLEQIKTKRPEEVFRLIADHVKDTADSAQQTADLLKVMGDSAERLIPAFKSGFGELMDQAKEAGVVLEEETLTQLDELASRIGVLASQFTSVLAPAIVFVSKRLSEMLDFVRIIVGRIPVFLGTLAGGGSFKDARAAAQQYTDDIIDKRIAAERQIEQRIAARKKHREQAPGAEEEPAQAVAAAIERSVRPQVDALQRIGLFVGQQDPGVRDRRQTLAELRNIRQELVNVKNTIEKTV